MNQPPRTDTKTLCIGVLSLTAALLVAANALLRPSPASGLVTFKDRDFQLVTARTQGQGDTLYVMDNRSGKIAVYSYDPATRDVRPRVFGDISTLFQTGPAGGAPGTVGTGNRLSTGH